MLQKLFEVEEKIMKLFYDNYDVETKSMYIDYHPPVVERVWFQYEEYRVYLHKIHKCNESNEALFHPHPWKSAIRIIKGSYEMGVGHSATNKVPPIDCKLILSEGSCYEMTEENGWHYVNPISDYVYSLMITGERSTRPMPVEPDKKFRELTFEEYCDIFKVGKLFYESGSAFWTHK